MKQRHSNIIWPIASLLAALLALTCPSAFALTVEEMHTAVPATDMTWEIWSVGDAEMVWKALQAVAAISNAGGFDTLVKIGLMGGMFFALIKAAVTQAPMGMQGFIGAFTGIMLMFGPTVSVVVWDAYTADGYQQDGVPIGVAVPMSVVTTAGKVLTETFESAYQDPVNTGMDKMSQHGFASALQVLIALRDLNFGPYNDVGKGGHSDLRRSVVNYITDCVMEDMNSSTPAISQSSLDMARDAWTQMGLADFVNIDTVLFLNAGAAEGEQKSCRDAYNLLSAELEVSGATLFEASTPFNQYVRHRMKKKDSANVTLDAQQYLSDSVATLLGQSMDNSALFMRQAILNSAMRTAKMQYASADQMSATIMLTEAEQRRNVQWAAEQTLFEKYMRPLQAFLEMFVVATAPIMAFVMALGPQGIALGGKYLFMVAWIALWGPVLTICHFYTQFQARKAFGNLLTGSGAIDESNNPITGDTVASMMTIAQMDGVFEEASRWIATGGMLAASTPALTLMLVYGGAVSATHLAGRLGGGDQINEGHMAPNASTPPPLVAGSAKHSYNPGAEIGGAGHGGIMQNGLQQPSYSFRSGDRSQVESARVNALTAEDTLRGAASQAFSADQRVTKGYEEAKSAGKSTTGEYSQLTGAAIEVGRNTARSLTEDSKQQDAITAATAGSIGGSFRAGVGVPVFGGAEFKTDMTKRLEGSGQFSRTEAAQMAERISANLTQNQGAVASLRSAATSSDNASAKIGFDKGDSASAGARFETAKMERNSAQENYRRADAAYKDSSVEMKVDGGQVMAALSRDRETGGAAASAIQSREEQLRADPEKYQQYANWVGASRAELSKGALQSAFRAPEGSQERQSAEQLAKVHAMKAMGDEGYYQAMGKLFDASAGGNKTGQGAEANAGLAKNPDGSPRTAASVVPDGQRQEWTAKAQAGGAAAMAGGATVAERGAATQQSAQDRVDGKSGPTPEGHFGAAKGQVEKMQGAQTGQFANRSQEIGKMGADSAKALETKSVNDKLGAGGEDLRRRSGGDALPTDHSGTYGKEGSPNAKAAAGKPVASRAALAKQAAARLPSE